MPPARHHAAGAETSGLRRPAGRRTTTHRLKYSTPASYGSRFVWITDVLPDELTASAGELMDRGIAAIKQTLEPAASDADTMLSPGTLHPRWAGPGSSAMVTR